MKQCCRQSSIVCTRLVRLLLLLWLSGSVLPTVSGADRIVLRNLKIITDKTVTAFDEDGVRLDGTQVLGWDEIEKAKVAAEKQEAFDKMLGELGGDLYRIHQRLTVGDYEGLLPHAEAIQERFVGRTSDTAFTVLQALMWGRLAVGQREAALAPYLMCYDILSRRGKPEIQLPGERRLLFDAKTALTSDITPVWFDAVAARAEMPKVYQLIRGMKQRPDGVYIYYASLASAAGDDAAAGRVLQAVRGEDRTILELRDIVQAQREIAATQPGPATQRLQEQVATYTADNQPLAFYWVGRSKLLSTDVETQQRGLLDLLRIPPLHGDRQPELAAAALWEVMQRMAANKEIRGSVAVRGELLARFGKTHFAAKVKVDDAGAESAQ